MTKNLNIYVATMTGTALMVADEIEDFCKTEGINTNIVEISIKKYKRLPCHELIRSNFLNRKTFPSLFKIFLSLTANFNNVFFFKAKHSSNLINIDLINTWQGSLLYFFILVLTIFILKRYFILNVNVIEIQNIENQMVDK